MYQESGYCCKIHIFYGQRFHPSCTYFSVCLLRYMTPLHNLAYFYYIVMTTTSKSTRSAVRSMEYQSINTPSQKCDATKCQPISLLCVWSVDISTSDTSFFSERQGTLDSVVTKNPRPPAFTQAGLLDFIIELVVLGDKVHIYIFILCKTSN